jgi:hypothetical protein
MTPKNPEVDRLDPRVPKSLDLEAGSSERDSNFGTPRVKPATSPKLRADLRVRVFRLSQRGRRRDAISRAGADVLVWSEPLAARVRDHHGQIQPRRDARIATQ